MGVFRFKRFSVLNERSAMKVNSDGVLLGAAVHISDSTRTVLDIGTGTGTIALMLAQRLYDLLPPSEADKIRISGIDIDTPSAEEAAANFASSPWSHSLAAHSCPVQKWIVPEGGYDLIVSNPPFFDNSLQNPDPRENAARHSVTLSTDELARFASTALAPGGTFALILCSDMEKSLLRQCASYGLGARRIIRIHTSEKKPPKRIICEFGKLETKACPVIEELTIGSEKYLEITDDFYLGRSQFSGF